MKYFFTIVFLIYLLPVKAGHKLILQNPVLNDTIIQDEKLEDELIDSVINTKAPPSKDKVQYFSQVTKYGFKNLFSNYAYNPTLPYAAQVNINASAFIDGYMKEHGKYLQGMKGWGQPYFNLIESILMQYGLPRELKYIAVIESNLRSGATSYKGAGGPWQLMPGTARELGLSVNQFVDDRRDYFRSTHAAAKYLLKNYRIFHDWLLVMAAYNGGPGRVFSAIKKSGSRNFWALQYYLPEESRTYVKRFIATHYIMEGTGGITTTVNNNSVFGNGGGGLPSENPFDKKPSLTEEELAVTATQTISGKFNSLVIAKNLAMDINQFNRYNPDFDAMMSSNGNYDLRLPEDKMQVFLANKYVILNECIQILLGENTISGNQTFYPSPKPVKATRKKKV